MSNKKSMKVGLECLIDLVREEEKHFVCFPSPAKDSDSDKWETEESVDRQLPLQNYEIN